MLERGAKRTGRSGRTPWPRRPPATALKLKPIRIGLYDQYGGLMPSGWTRWLLEQYEFPFEVVYPADARCRRSEEQVRRAGVLGRRRAPAAPRADAAGSRFRPPPDPESIPERVPGMAGPHLRRQTVPQLQKFVEAGRSRCRPSEVPPAWRTAFGIPVKNYLTEMGPDGRSARCRARSSTFRARCCRLKIDNSNPLAYGMPDQAGRLLRYQPGVPAGASRGNRSTPSAVAWFAGTHVLDSGWAWGQQYLDGGTAVVGSRGGRRQGRAARPGSGLPRAAARAPSSCCSTGCTTEAQSPRLCVRDSDPSKGGRYRHRGRQRSGYHVVEGPHRPREQRQSCQSR